MEKLSDNFTEEDRNLAETAIYLDTKKSFLDIQNVVTIESKLKFLKEFIDSIEGKTKYNKTFKFYKYCYHQLRSFFYEKVDNYIMAENEENICLKYFDKSYDEALAKLKHFYTYHHRSELKHTLDPIVLDVECELCLKKQKNPEKEMVLEKEKNLEETVLDEGRNIDKAVEEKEKNIEEMVLESKGVFLR